MIRAFAIFILLALCAPAWAVEVDAINGIPISKLKAINGVSITKIKAINGVTIASPLTCTVLSANSAYTATVEFLRYNAQQYHGIIWDDGSSGSICSVKQSFFSTTGDLTGKDFYAEVWLLGASSVLSSLIARSDKVDGQNWSAAVVTFTFSTPAAYDCTGSNQYGILIKAIANDAAASSAGTYDGTNYPVMRYSNGTNTMTGNVAKAIWTATTNVLQSSDATDMPIFEVWTMQ